MNNQTFTEQQLQDLRGAFAAIHAVSPNSLPKFHAILDQMNDAQMKQVAGANVKFLSKLAVNEFARRQS